MNYRVFLSDDAISDFSRIDKSQRELIFKWIRKHLDGANDPRAFGKALSDGLKGLRHYRVGDYRLIANIVDDEVKIIIVHAGHRSRLYE